MGPLMTAIAKEYWELYELLLDWEGPQGPADIHQQDLHLINVLMIAAGVRGFKDCGCNVHVPQYATPHVDRLKDLIKRQAAVYCCDFNRNTPLIRAATWGFGDVVDALLNADPTDQHVHHKNKWKLTAVDMAKRYGHRNIVEKLGGVWGDEDD